MMQIDDQWNRSAEDVRSFLYEIAAEAHLACTALDARAEDCSEDETIAAVWRLLERAKLRAKELANKLDLQLGGPMVHPRPKR
jgi:hypothetical protein